MPIAIVTGANRGIGREVCQQLAARNHTVILTARNADQARQAAAGIAGQVIPHQLNVTDAASIEALRAWVAETYGVLDVLINNAGINYDTHQNVVSVTMESVLATLETNTLGAWRMIQAFLPLLHRSDHPRVVNVSSGAGSLETMGGGTPAYNFSKAGLNAISKMFAQQLRGAGILVNAVCPGWVATDRGGSGGRPVSDGAAGIVWAATLPDDGPSGGFFRDGQRVAW